MKRYLWLVVLLFVMTGCNASERIYHNTKVQDKTIINFVPPADIEAQITDSINQIEMEPEKRIKLRNHRVTIGNEILYLKSEFEVGAGEIDFTSYVEGLKRLKWNWIPIRTDMDRWSIGGDLTATASGYWYFIRGDTERLMRNIDKVIKATEEDISEQAMEEYMRYFNEAIQIIRPLVGF